MSTRTSPPSPSWQLLLEGAPQLRSDGRLVPLERRDAALLAWLAMAGSLSREAGLALLWPDEPAEAVRNRLRQRMYALKQRLGVAAVEGAAMLVLGGGIRWDGLPALGDRPLLGDDAYADLPEFAAWLQARRAEQAAARRDARAGAAARLAADGRLAEAILQAEALVGAEPLFEHGHRLLMRLHHQRGDRAAAIAAFERCERQLREELGTRPSSETVALLAQVESARPPALPVARAVPATLLRPPRLVGRQDEWARLMLAWRQQRPVVLIAEGGMGKSRLLGDLAAAGIFPPAGVLQVAARPGDAELPWASASRLLRTLAPVRERRLEAGLAAELARLLPELGPAPTAPSAAGSTAGPAAGMAVGAGQVAGQMAGQAGARLANAVRAVVQQAATEGLQALVLDDLHLADGASLDLLQPLLGEPRPIWAAAFRPAPRSPALASFIDALRLGGDALVVDLPPLAAPAIAEFVDTLAVPGLDGATWARPLLQRTGGNPQYMLETLKAWLMQTPAAMQDAGLAAPAASSALAEALPVPATLPRLIAQRIGSLSTTAVALARCAAVAGQDFSAELAAQVLRLRATELADPWAELEAAHVFAGGRFAHDLVAEAARASVPQPVARLLHGEVAQALADLGAPVEPARLAHHWRCAERWPATAEACEAAARRCAQQPGRRADEAAQWVAAAEAWGRCDRPARRFEALLAAAALQVVHDQTAVAAAAVEAAAAAATDDDQRRRVLNLRLAWARARRDEATTLHLAPQAVDQALKAQRPDEALAPALSLAGALAASYRADEALAVLDRVRDWVQGPQADDEARRQWWNTRALALDHAHRYAEALPAWDQTQHFARQAGSDLLAQAIGNASYTLNKMGRMAEAVERARESLRLVQSLDDGVPAQRLFGQLALGHHLRNAGQLAEALHMLAAAREGLRGAGRVVDGVRATHLLALLWVQLGQPARARRLLQDDEGAALPPDLARTRQAHQARVLLALGRRTEAEALAQVALPDDPAPEDLLPRVWALLLAPALPAPQAEAQAVRAAAWLATRQRLGLALAAQVQAAAAMLRQDAPARALPYVEAAAELARAHQPDIDTLCDRWWVAAQVYGALGLHARRSEAVAEAARWIRRTADSLDAPLRAAFLQRQPVHADLLHWAQG